MNREIVRVRLMKVSVCVRVCVCVYVYVLSVYMSTTECEIANKGKKAL